MKDRTGQAMAVGDRVCVLCGGAAGYCATVKGMREVVVRVAMYGAVTKATRARLE